MARLAFAVGVLPVQRCGPCGSPVTKAAAARTTAPPALLSPAQQCSPRAQSCPPASPALCSLGPRRPARGTSQTPPGAAQTPSTWTATAHEATRGWREQEHRGSSGFGWVGGGTKELSVPDSAPPKGERRTPSGWGGGRKKNLPWERPPPVLLAPEMTTSRLPASGRVWHPPVPQGGLSPTRATGTGFRDVGAGWEGDRPEDGSQGTGAHRSSERGQVKCCLLSGGREVPGGARRAQLYARSYVNEVMSPSGPFNSFAPVWGRASQGLPGGRPPTPNPHPPSPPPRVHRCSLTSKRVEKENEQNPTLRHGLRDARSPFLSVLS